MNNDSETINDICLKLRSIDKNDRCGVKEVFNIKCGKCSNCTADTANALADRIEKAYRNSYSNLNELKLVKFHLKRLYQKGYLNTNEYNAIIRILKQD